MREREREEVAGASQEHARADDADQIPESALEAMHRDFGNAHVMRVLASVLNVRSSPDASGSGNILGQVARGAEVLTFGQVGPWRTIAHPRGRAYLHGDYLAPSGPEAEAHHDEKPDVKPQDLPPPVPDTKNDAHSDQLVGEQHYESRSITFEELDQAMSEAAPSMPRELRTMMLGHAWGEQGGKNIINNNFAGMEGGSAAYVVTWTSTVVSRAEIQSHRDKYKDWAPKGPPGCVTWQGRDAHTIAVQLERDEPQIAALVKKKRPAYATLADAAKVFIKNIESKLTKLQSSADPAHQELAAQALAGDVDAYARVVTLSAPKLGIYPYNPGKEYPALVKRHIAEARAHFGG